MTLGFNHPRRIFCRAPYQVSKMTSNRASNNALLGGAAFIALFLGLPISAYGDNIAKCEIVITETITGESGENNAQIASYRPAADFIASIYNSEKDADIAIIRDVDGYPIRALLCTRKDIIITESDFPLLASAIPFMISQNFDSPNSDLMSYYYKDGAFHYNHKGKALPAAALDILTTRMAKFNQNTPIIEALSQSEIKADKDQTQDQSQEQDIAPVSLPDENDAENDNKNDTENNIGNENDTLALTDAETE